MSRKPRPHEDQKGSAGANNGKTPLARFEGLTRRLLKVSPEEVREQQRRYEKARDAAKRE